MATWTQLAAQIPDGYLPGNSWERMLQKNLDPVLVKELGTELQAYLQVQTNNAMELAERMEEQGTPPELARSTALASLLGTLP